MILRVHKRFDFIDVHFTYAIDLRLCHLKVTLSQIAESCKLHFNRRATCPHNSRSASLGAVLTEEYRQPNIKISTFGATERAIEVRAHKK
jgi:hypothetical protein